MSEPKEKIPTRFHIGTQKAGSTFLYNLLKSHPDVSLSSQSEIHFYNKYFDRGFPWYESLFHGDGVHIDTSPKYFMNGEVVAPRIKEMCGEDTRIVLFLRNPIDLINSHYQMHVVSGHFHNHPNAYPKVPTSVLDCIEKYPTYLKQALYHQQLQVWLRYFDISQIKIVIFEEFVKDVGTHMEDLLDFWGLPQRKLTAAKTSKNKMLRNRFLFVLRGKIMGVPFLKNFLQKNTFSNWIYDTYLTAPSSKNITKKQREALKDLLTDDVQKLGVLLERDLSQVWSDFKL